MSTTRRALCTTAWLQRSSSKWLLDLCPREVKFDEQRRCCNDCVKLKGAYVYSPWQNQRRHVEFLNKRIVSWQSLFMRREWR